MGLCNEISDEKIVYMTFGQKWSFREGGFVTIEAIKQSRTQLFAKSALYFEFPRPFRSRLWSLIRDNCRRIRTAP